ncbi:sensor histidine kinase [Litorimonas haliclonae]|uniref:sensor histidine kinase n=1 Tax=Litorimonas haliclonae TaxID=2081977 RepID=UPI0039EEA043
MTYADTKRAVSVPSLIWLAILAAAFFAAFLRNVAPIDLAIPAGVAAFPAVITLLFIFGIHKEWVQILVLLSWLALAIVACLFVGFMPLAILFLAPPVMAALFRQEKIVEALVMSVILAGLLYFALIRGSIPESPLTATQTLWATQTGVIGLIALVVGTLFASAQLRQGNALHYASKGHLNQTDFETLQGSVLKFEQDGKLVTANLEAQKVFDIPSLPSPVTLTSLLERDKTEQAAFMSICEKVRETEQSWSTRLSVPDGDGEITVLDSYIAPQKNGGLILHAIDRTAEESRIEDLRRSHAMASRETDDKTLFFAGVSHELRTPLNAIIGFSDMMRSRLFGPLPSKYAEYADLIHDSGQHMLDLIGDVLDLSKVEAGKYTLQYDSFDAADVIRSSVKMIRPAADAAEVRLDVSVDVDETLIVEADRKALRQILLNLLSNAIKFSDKGGRVSVKAVRKDGYLVLRVTDEGEGISAEDLITIGTPYTQSASGLSSEERGSGLGLSLVKSLTELHRGEFDIESQLGEGTQVTVSLPLSRAK